MNKISSLLIVLVAYLNIYSQAPSDCQNSIISCGNNNLSLNVNGGGNVQELNNTNNCSVSTENNSLWIKVTVATSGTLGFTLTPASTNIIEDYDFFIFGPNVTCGNLGFAIRCSTTNPQAASQGNNLTGMNGTETDIAEGPGSNGNSFIRWLDVTVGESYYLVLDRPAGNSAFSLVWNGTATFSDPPINNFPVATSINLEDCDDNGDGLVTFDLTQNEATIIGVQNVTPSYHTNISDAQIGINPITNPTTFSSANTTLYLRLIDNITDCTTVIDFDLIVENLIDTQPPNLLFCDTNNDGIHTFDLSQQDNIIIGTQANPQVSYHLSQADAINNNAPIATLFTNTQNPQIVWGRLADTVTGCFDITSFSLEVFDTPIANSPLDWFACDTDNDGFFQFNFSSLNGQVLSGQSAAAFNISYHNTLVDADANTNPIILYTNTNAYTQEQIFVRIENVNNTNCYNTTSFAINVFDTPVTTTLQDWLVCDTDNDGFFTFNLTSLNTSILNGFNATDYTISFHPSQNDADLNLNSLPSNYTNTTAYIQETIFARIENNLNTDCFDSTSINIDVFDTPIATQPTNWWVCDTDNDGFFIFDFSTLDNQVLNGQNTTTFNVSYHNTLADADTNSNSLNLYTNANAHTQEQIFARIENVNNTNCYNTTSFAINVFDTPVTTTLQDWLVCDDNSNGFFVFNLTDLNSTVLNGFSATDYTISFHNNQNDADLNINTLPTSYTNTTAYTSEIIFARIQNNLNTDCFDTTSVTLRIFEIPIANTVLDWITCDDIDNDGFYNFDLSTLNTQILNGQNIADSNISFHNSLLNADMNTNPLDLNYTNTDAFTLETIFVRIENSNKADCFDTSSFDINVIENPVFDVDEETKYICINLLPQTVPFEVINSNNNYSYSWKDVNGVELSTSSILNATASGDYTVTATTTDGNNCSTTKTVHLLPAAPAVITNVIIKEYFVDDRFSALVEINGISNYEYAIAHNGVLSDYQEDPLFLNLSPGLYTIYVREKIGCGIVSRDIAVFGFPKFFTPNGDGINDSWLVPQLAFTPNAKIYIFDRYGKVLFLFYPAKNMGWNGFYKNALVPKADYWFIAEITDYSGKFITRKGHFSLKK